MIKLISSAYLKHVVSVIYFPFFMYPNVNNILILSTCSVEIYQVLVVLLWSRIVCRGLSILHSFYLEWSHKFLLQSRTQQGSGSWYRVVEVAFYGGLHMLGLSVLDPTGQASCSQLSAHLISTARVV